MISTEKYTRQYFAAHSEECRSTPIQQDTQPTQQATQCSKNLWSESKKAFSDSKTGPETPKSRDNDSTITKGMDDADIAELTNLNDYVDKIRFEHRQNLIPNREHKVEVNTKPFLSNHDLFRKVQVISKPLWVNIAQSCNISFLKLYFSTPPFSTFNSHNIKSTISNLADTSKQAPVLLTLVQTSNPPSGGNKNQFPNKSHSLI